MNNDDLQNLKELQVLDSKIRSLEQEKADKPKILEEKNKTLQKQEDKLGDKKQELKDIRIETDKKELEIKIHEDKTNKLNVQLNVIKTNKEYSAILTEINSIKVDNSLLEDETLLFFSKSETLQEECNEIRKQIEKEQGGIAELAKDIESVVLVLDKQLDELYQTRGNIVENIPAEFVQSYDKIISHKSDHVALAQVVDDVCHGCFMDVTPQQVNELMKGRESIFCRHCSRILYL